LNYNKKIGLLICLGTLLRMTIAALLELGNDEVYYQTYARHLQWNYFDHPPMVALLIRFSTLNLFLQNDFFIRLGPILCAAAGTWLIYKIGSRIRNSRTGWFAAILYNTSFYTSIIAGTFILPDSPQVVFWLLSMYFMVRISEYKAGEEIPPGLFILLGLISALCIMSKVHGIFLWFGFGLFVLFRKKELLKNPMLWLSGLVCLCSQIPVYLWNLENHFITYKYHEGRIRFWGSTPDMSHFLQQVLGSVFYNNPVNFILYIFTLIALFRKKNAPFPDRVILLLCLCLPLILVLVWASLFSETLPHWSGPAYLSFMLLASCWLEEKQKTFTSAWLKTSGWVYGTTVVLAIWAIRYLPFQIGSNKQTDLGAGDVTLDMSGWTSFSRSFDSLYQTDINSNKMKAGSVLISDYWFPAGHLEHYYSIPYGHNLIVFGPVNNIHHFAWLNWRRPRLIAGSDAYFIFPSNYYGPPASYLKKEFAHVEDSLLIPQFRNGTRVRNFVVYRMHNFIGDSLDYLTPAIH
jgi:hypothetical protein